MESNIGSDGSCVSYTNNQLMIFGIGMLIGSIIGLNGIIILIVAGLGSKIPPPTAALLLCMVGYYYRKSIGDIITEMSMKRQTVLVPNNGSDASCVTSLIQSWKEVLFSWKGTTESVKKKKDS